MPRAPRPAVAVPPAPANYVPQSLRPSQSAGAIAASEEGRSQVRNRERVINFLFTVLLLAAVRKGKGRQSIYQAGTGFSCFVCTSDDPYIFCWILILIKARPVSGSVSKFVLDPDP